jgi:uncharacterized protein
MSIQAILKEKRMEIIRIAERHGARNIRVFGSAARQEATDDSDVDLLVDMDRGKSYLDLVALWQDLEELLGRKVDVLTDGGISPYLYDSIKKEAVAL